MAELESPDPAPLGHPTSKQQRILWSALTALAVLTLVGVAGLVFYGFVALLSWSYPLLLPIGLAVLVALVLEPLVDFAQKRRGIKRENAALLVCILTVTALVLFWAFLSGTVINSGASFFNKLPRYLDDGLNKVEQMTVSPGLTREKLEAELPSPAPEVALTNQAIIAPPLSTNAVFTPAQPSTNQLIAPATLNKDVPQAQGESDAGLSPASPTVFQTWLKENLPAMGQALQKNVANVIYSALGPVGQAFGFLLGFGFVPIYVYYFLAEEETIVKHWHEYVPLRRSPFRDEVVSVLAEISASLVSYLRGQIIVAACNGVLTFIGLSIIGLGFQNSLVLGIITGTLSIVPFLGIISSIIPSVLIAFLGEPFAGIPWLRPVLVLVVFAVVQMSESMFITPRVQSHSTGLHPLTIIIGILFWSMLLPGLLGPIVGVPLTCAVVVLMRRYIWLEKTGKVVAEAKEIGS
jgi:predicted PurR-regulated permease PerM